MIADFISALTCEADSLQTDENFLMTTTENVFSFHTNLHLSCDETGVFTRGTAALDVQCSTGGKWNMVPGHCLQR